MHVCATAVVHNVCLRACCLPNSTTRMTCWRHVSNTLDYLDMSRCMVIGFKVANFQVACWPHIRHAWQVANMLVTFLGSRNICCTGITWKIFSFMLNETRRGERVKCCAVECSYRPVVTLQHYNIIMYSLGGAHCFFSFLVLVTYFLSNHPTLPSITSILQRIRYVSLHLGIFCKIMGFWGSVCQRCHNDVYWG